MNTALVCLVFALSSSWTPPAVTPGFDPAAIFASEDPVGLFDEVTAWEFDSRNEFGMADGSTHSRSRAPIRSQPGRMKFPSLLRAQRDFLIHAQNRVIRAQSPAPLLADGVSGADSLGRPFPSTYSHPASLVPVFMAPVSAQGQSEESLPNQPAPTYGQPVPGQAPFIAPPMTAMPGATTWGANGPQPFRQGYSLWADVGWMPQVRTSLPGDVRFGVFETNVGLNHTVPTGFGPWLFSLQNEFGYRNWDFSPIRHLDLYRVGWDARLDLPLNNGLNGGGSPFGVTLALNPSINTDFEKSLGRNAVNIDGRGIFYWQADPRLMLAAGAGFWDRVHDRVIPYAGVVWLPDDRWEFRLLFPESRISYYLGNHCGIADTWLYVTGQYHVESYEVASSGSPTGRDQIEMEDWRVLLGLRKSSPHVSGFIEAGWVFGRTVELRSGPSFDPASGFIGRVGIRF